MSGQRQGFFQLFAAELPAFEDAEPLLNRMLSEKRDVLLEQLNRRRARRVIPRSAR